MRDDSAGNEIGICAAADRNRFLAGRGCGWLRRFASGGRTGRTRVALGGSGAAEEPSAKASAVVDAGPPKPAVYVPAGMDAGDLAPVLPVAAASPIDAGSDAGKASTGKKGKK